MARKNPPFHFVLQDLSGCTIRYLNFGKPSADRSQEREHPITAVWLTRARRLEFVNNVEILGEQKFEILRTFSTDEIKKSGEINESGFKIVTPKGTFAIKAVQDIASVREDAPISKSKDKQLSLFLKYTTAIEIAALGLVFVLAWVSARFFSPTPKAVTVQVFSQQDLNKLQPVQEIVNVSNRKVHMHAHQLPHEYARRNVRSQNRDARRSMYSSSHSHSHGRYSRYHYGRPGTSLANAGALGVLGGMGPQFHGSGGLNIHSHSNNPGIGYGGPALRGGFERGMLGKGLIATGIGDGSSLQGYGGTSRHGGLGGGAPGYGFGRMSMAGSAGAYFEPNADDAIVEGGLDRDQINAVIQQNLGQVTYCYEEGLQERPQLAGRVAVHFVIGSRGFVTVARVANTSLRSRQVEDCIVQKLRGWKFPRPAGNVSVRVTYPFVLKRLSQG